MTHEEIPVACRLITEQTGLPAFDLLLDGPDELIRIISPHIRKRS